MKCLSGQMKGSGKIDVKGKCAVLPQEPELLFVKDKLRDDLEENSGGKTSLLEQYINLCGMEGQMESHPYDLSGGQQQMAALIKVLLTEPDILLLDEPTKGMDRLHKMRLGQVLQQLCRKGTAILCVTHDMEFAAAFAGRAAMLFDGKLEGEDRPEAFFTNNYFYTTTAAKITRGLKQPVILPEEVKRL